MRKYICTLVICLVFTCLFSAEKEDLYFIKALMQDKYYQMAYDESVIFLKKYPNTDVKDELLLIQADILIQQKNYTKADEILCSINSIKLSPLLEQNWLLLQTEKSLYLNQGEDLLLFSAKYINRYPNDIGINKIYILLGDYYLSQEDYDMAKECYSKVRVNSIELDSKILNLYLMAEDKENAELCYQKILSSYNKNDIDYATYILTNYFERKKDWLSINKTLGNYFDTYFDLPLTQLNDIQKNLFYLLLNSLLEVDKPDDVIELLSKYIDNNDRKAYYEGLALIKIGEIVDGLQVLEGLYSTTNDKELKNISFFQIISNKSTIDIDKAIDQLNEYLIKNSEQKWVGDIYYQIAFNQYKQKKYNDALDNLNRALSFGTGNFALEKHSEEFEEKALFLKAECLFFLGKKKECIAVSETFYNKFSNSAFIDELIFKMSMCLYQAAQVDSSRYFFSEIVENYASSAKYGISNYYLGEIELAKARYNSAKDYYLKALNGIVDIGATFLRLSYVEYALKNYNQAKEYIDKVPEENDYLFDKYMLKGNIFFNERDYNEALNCYKIAETNVPDQLSFEHLMSRQAWTLYRLKRFDEATTIYKNLAEQSNSPGEYKLAAADAAYNAEDFMQALELYSEYVDEYPESPDIIKAIAGIANSHFNLANFSQSISTWEKLVDIKYSQETIQNAVNGIQWSFQQQNNKKEYSKWIGEKIRKTSNVDLKTILYESKIKYEYENEDYLSSISSILQLFQQYPEKESEEKFQIMLANNYIWLKQYEKADRIYVQLVIKNNSPEVYHEWGNIKWAQEDTAAALKRYKRAANTSQQPEYWLVLLEKQFLANDDEFEKYYNDFILFADDYYIELANLVLVDKLINDQQIDKADEIVHSLNLSDNPLVRAKSVYNKARILYIQEDYNNALKEFLRIRYVYTELTELRWDSEYYICKIYTQTQEVDKAKELYSRIKSYISKAQNKELSTLLGETN